MTVPALGLLSLYHPTHGSLILDDMAVCVLLLYVLGVVSLLMVFKPKLSNITIFGVVVINRNICFNTIWGIFMVLFLIVICMTGI